MIELYVNGQALRLYTPVIAADTLHYLTGKVHFSGSEWDGYTKAIHFTRDETVHDVILIDDAFNEDVELNLTTGEWTVFLTGAKTEDGVESRLTTVPVILIVKPSGLVAAPMDPMPLSVAEQVATQAATAMRFAADVKAQAEAGAFNGADGRSFVIDGFYDTLAELEEAVHVPDPGAAYGVGTDAPYDIYIWDAANSEWVNNGQLQGAQGERGPAGTTFIPNVDTSGNIYWTNDGGLENPTSRNIRGPKGDAGPAGIDGKSPYEVAVENGYTGTLANFNASLAIVADHHARHLPNGGDPILVQTGNLDAGAVTREKLGTDAVSSLFSATIGTVWAGTSSTDTQYLSPDGETTDFEINGAPESIIQVKVLATSVILIEGTDYTYGSGTLHFLTEPAEGTNTHEVTFPVTVAPFTQDVNVPGILANDKVIIDVNVPSTVLEADTILDAYANIYKVTVADNTLTFYSFDALNTQIPITVLAIGR